MLLSYTEEKTLADRYYSRQVSRSKDDVRPIKVSEILEDLRAVGEFNPNGIWRIFALAELGEAEERKIPAGLITMIRHRQRHRVRFIVMKPGEFSDTRVEINKKLGAEAAASALRALDNVPYAFELYLGHYSNHVVIDNRDVNNGVPLSKKWTEASERIVFVVPVLAEEKDGQARVLLNTDKLERVMKEHKQHIEDFLSGTTDRYQPEEKDAEYELLAMCLLSPSLARRSMIVAVNLVASDDWSQFPSPFSTCLLPGTPKLPVSYLFTTKKRPSVLKKSESRELPYERLSSRHLPFQSTSKTLVMKGGENIQARNTTTLAGIRDTSSSTEQEYGGGIGHGYGKHSSSSADYYGGKHSKTGGLGKHKAVSTGSLDYAYAGKHGSKSYAAAVTGSTKYQHKHGAGKTCAKCKDSFFVGCRYCGGGDD